MKRLLSRTHKLNLTEGDIVKNIWLLASPIMLGNILQTAFNIIDMIWVGRLGSEAIASVALSGVVLMVIITLIIGIASGTQSLVSRFIGSGNQLMAENVAMQSLLIGTALSILLAGLSFVLSRPVLQLIGASGVVLQEAEGYLNIILAGGLTIIYLFMINAIFRAAADAMTPMLIMLGATILNVVLDPLLIFGIGFPRMGVRGAALATVFSQGAATLAGLYILFQGHSRIRVHLTRFKADWQTIVKITKIGFPNCIQMSLRSVVGLILMTIVAKYGSDAIAAYGIGLRVFSVVMMPGFALAVSAATVVGQNLGAKKLMRAEKSAIAAAKYNTMLMGFTGLIFFIFSNQIIFIFSSNPQIIAIGSDYLRITSFGYIFVAQGMVLGRSLIGAGDAISPMTITLITLLGIQIPLAVILPRHINTGLAGVWWAILISSILQGTLTYFWFNRGFWKSKRL